MKCYLEKHKGIEKLCYRHRGRVRLNVFAREQEVKPFEINRKKEDTFNYAIEFIDSYKNEFGMYPTADIFKSHFQTHRDRNITSMLLMDFFRQFLKDKKEELNVPANRKTNYDHVGNWIMDYELFIKKQLTLSDLKMKTINNLINFMLKDKKNFKTKKDGGEYISNKILKYSTIHSRISKLRTFWLWLYKNKYLPYDIDLNDRIIKIEEKIEEPNRYYPNLDEQNKLSKMDFEDDELNYAKDMMVFLGDVGMRDSDLRTLTPKHIKPVGNEREIDKRSVKTNKRFVVRLNSRANDIVNRYQTHDVNTPIFNRMKQNKLNHLIKIVARKSALFDEETQFQNESGQYYKKHELMSTHSGRYAFINNAIEIGETPENIIKSTGQTLNTFKIYQKRYGHSPSFTKKFVSNC